MRSNTIRETLLSKYTPSSPNIRLDTLYKSRASKTKGSTLEDFYREVYAKSESAGEHAYMNKNAKEIEVMMMQNRKLIESTRHYKK